MRRASNAILLTAAAIVLVVGCATHVNTPTATATGNGTGPARPAATTQSPKQRAEAEVAALLKSFVPPPGARRLTTAPAALKTPVTALASGYQARGVTFWSAPGDPRALIAWEKAHIATRFTVGDADFGPPAWDQMFQLPAVPGVLTSRDLVMEVVGLGNGETGIRVDAEVGWQPSRPAAGQVPPSARIVTITQLPSPVPDASRPPAPVTITGATLVKRLVALLNALPVSQFNGVVVPCPMPPAGGLLLTFRATPGGPVLAQARTGQPCGVTSLTVGARQPLLLNNVADQRILEIARLHWTPRTPEKTGMS